MVGGSGCNGPRKPRLVVGQDAEIGEGRARDVRSSPASRKRLASYSAAGGSGLPGSTISSPVENTATRTRRRTGNSVSPTAAASATCGVVSRRPAGSITDLARKSSPAARRLAPRFRPGGTTTVSPSTRVSSCMNTVSAPSGIGAPVKMRIASPAPSARVAARPGGDAIDDLEPGVARGGKIGMAHGIAVDRRIVERRQIDRRQNIQRDDTAARSGERHRLGLRHRRNTLRDQLLHLGHRQQRAAKGEAIVGELRHHAAPCGARTSASGAASTVRMSAIFSMSSSETTGSSTLGSGTSEATATTQLSSGCSSGLPTMAR